MDEKPVLTKEELAALLGEQADEIADGQRAEAEEAAAPETGAALNLNVLTNTIFALTGRIEVLERQVKELRLQALAFEREDVPEDGRAEGRTRRKEGPGTEIGVGKSGGNGNRGGIGNGSGLDKQSDAGQEVRLSRVERYGKSGAGSRFKR
jgi:hypothetical protein